MHCYFPFTPVGECCPVCMETGKKQPAGRVAGNECLELNLSLHLHLEMMFSPVPSGPHLNSVTPLTQERVCREEEEQLRRKKEAKKKRRKNKEEQVQKQRKLVKERGAEKEPQILELEKEEEKWWKQTVEVERKRREEEARRRKEATERKTRENERHLEEEIRRQEENLRKNLPALMEDEEEQLEEEFKERLEEVDEWMEKVREEEEEPPKHEEPEEWQPSDLRPPAETEDEQTMVDMEEEENGEEVESHSGLPPGCLIAEVTATCDSLRLAYFPPLSVTELRSLSLEGE